MTLPTEAQEGAKASIDRQTSSRVSVRMEADNCVHFLWLIQKSRRIRLFKFYRVLFYCHCSRMFSGTVIRGLLSKTKASDYFENRRSSHLACTCHLLQRLRQWTCYVSQSTCYWLPASRPAYAAARTIVGSVSVNWCSESSDYGRKQIATSFSASLVKPPPKPINRPI